MNKDFPAAFLPFWGDYYFLDFAMANFKTLAPDRVFVVANNRSRSFIPFFTSRWAGEDLILLDKGLPQFCRLLADDSSRTVVISSLSQVSYLDRDSLVRLCRTNAGEPVKLSINKIPLDIYIAGRRRLLEALDSFQPRATSDILFEQLLFAEVLHTSFVSIEDLPGVILFHNNLMELYKENLWLIHNTGSLRHADILARLNGAKVSARKTVIEDSGFSRDSFIASGARIDGSVEDSIIFSDVIIRKGARVINSIVMNNNRIGSGSLIQGAMIFPDLEEAGRGVDNIGKNVSIGAKRSTARNEHYPEHIRDGLTVLGLSPDIPDGYIIEPGCFVGPGVSNRQLKEFKRVRRGSSVYADNL